MENSSLDEELLGIALAPLKPQKRHRMAVNESNLVYVGNLSFYTYEEQIWELFSKVGPIKRVILGLDRIKKTPCGFCFVEFFSKDEGRDSMRFISGTRLDEMTIRTELDQGFTPGRQFGRGQSGGQIRDEYRLDFEPKRKLTAPAADSADQTKQEKEENPSKQQKTEES